MAAASKEVGKGVKFFFNFTDKKSRTFQNPHEKFSRTLQMFKSNVLAPQI